MEDLESALRDAGLEDAAIASFLRESGLTQRFELSEVGVDDLATCLVEACGVKRLKATIIAKAVKRDASSASAKALNTGIFWDVENVALPKGIDPSGASNCLRSVIHERFPSAEVNFKSYYYDSMAGAHVRRGREEISLAGWILNDCPTRNSASFFPHTHTHEYSHVICTPLLPPTCSSPLCSQRDPGQADHCGRNGLRMPRCSAAQPNLRSPHFRRWRLRVYAAEAP